MLVFGEKLLGMTIMSLQTSHEIARTEEAVINPANLTVVAYYVTGQTLDFSPALLVTADIREIGQMGAIINSSDDFTRPEDLVAIKDIIALQFSLIGMHVVDTHKQKLGKVIRYALDPETFVIHQLHIKRPLLKSFNDSELLINRTQIVSITQHTIVVKAADTKIGARLPNSKPLLSNPFHQNQPKVEAIDANRD
jgi:uncharacterized protein YrrD